MNPYTMVLAKLDKVASLSGKAKLPELGFFLDDPLFVSVCKMALDPMRTFGVRNFEVQPFAHPDMSGPMLSEFEYTMKLFETRELSGNDAKRTLEKLCRDGVPGELLIRIIRKDLRIGVGADTFNKISKGFVKTFKVALAEEYDSEAIQFPLYISPKFDGLRCIVLVAGENAQFLSRNGLPFQALQCHEDAFLALGGGDRMYDCEVLDGNFFTSLGVKKKKGKSENAIFQVFDTLPLNEFLSRVTTTEQGVRLSQLQDILGEAKPTETIQYCPHAFLATNELVMAAYDRYRAMGLEGVIAKKPKEPYQFRRSNAWTKIKDEKTLDLPLVEVEEGKGRLEGTMGKIVVRMPNGRLDRVGTGFTDEERAHFWKEKDNLKLAFDTGHPTIVEVGFHELTPDGSMRHSRFHKIRFDKTVEDGAGV